MSDTDSNDEDGQVEVLQSTFDQTEGFKGYQFEPRRSNVRPNFSSRLHQRRRTGGATTASTTASATVTDHAEGNVSDGDRPIASTDQSRSTSKKRGQIRPRTQRLG